MSREQPKNPPPPITKWSDEKQGRTIGGTQVVIQERRYRLITPLFGGGVEPGVNDPDNLIRATEIRGQLRFWWRAMRGGQFGGNLARMKEREDEIWGAASKTEHSQKTGEEQDKKAQWKEPVQLEINVSQIGQPVKPFKIVPKTSGNGYKAVSDNDIPDYAAFPLRPKDDDIKKMKTAIPLATLQQNVEFILTITFPTRWAEEVEAALWAWETFGGVGARTRRGFGCLQLVECDGKTNEDLPAADPADAKEWIEDHLNRWLQGDQHHTDFPHLKKQPRLVIVGSISDALQSWAEIINKLKDFRQWRYYYLDQKGKERPGRSKWPEAEMIRNLTKQRDKRRHPIEQPAKLPRAQLGLPIVFHFKDEKTGDPHDMTLQGPEEQERLASPLILRPLICQGGKSLGLALRLEGVRLPSKLFLEGKITDRTQKLPLSISQTQLTDQESATLPILGRETDAIQAFFEYLHSNKESKQL